MITVVTVFPEIFLKLQKSFKTTHLKTVLPFKIIVNTYHSLYHKTKMSSTNPRVEFDSPREVEYRNLYNFFPVNHVTWNNSIKTTLPTHLHESPLRFERQNAKTFYFKVQPNAKNFIYRVARSKLFLHKDSENTIHCPTYKRNSSVEKVSTDKVGSEQPSCIRTGYVELPRDQTPELLVVLWVSDAQF